MCVNFLEHNRMGRYRSKTQPASLLNVPKRSKSTGNIIVIKRPFTFVYGHKRTIPLNFIQNANFLCKQFIKHIFFHKFIPPFTSSRHFCWLRHGCRPYTELGTPNCSATYRQTLAIYRAAKFVKLYV